VTEELTIFEPKQNFADLEKDTLRAMLSDNIRYCCKCANYHPVCKKAAIKKMCKQVK